MARIKIFDHIPISSAIASRNIKLTDTQLLNGKKAVYATVRATHAARVTGNNGFYLPGKMALGAASMTAPYEKVIKAHHKDNMDPVGRVKIAKYIHTPLQDHSLKHLNSLNDSVSFSDAVDLVDQLNASGLLSNRDFPGLGYILSTGLITEPSAVEKVIDGRYQTVSIEAFTDKAVCSICRQDWAEEEGRCEHDPGEIVDGKKAFLIAGELEYDGWDWVNTPADQLATIVRMEQTNTADQLDINSISNNLENGHYLHVCDSLEDASKIYEIYTKKEEVPEIPAPVDIKPENMDSDKKNEDSKEKLSYNNNSISDLAGSADTQTEGEETMSKAVLEKLEELVDLEKQKDSIKVTELEDRLVTADAKVSMIRDELRIANADATDSSLAKVEAITDFRQLALKYINLVNTLTNGDAIEEKSLVELSLAGVADLVNKQAEKISDSLEDMVAKLNDGTTLITNDEPILDPTEPADTTDAGAVADSRLDEVIVNRVKSIRDSRGSDYAANYLRSLFAEKIVSAEELTEYAKILVVSDTDNE